MHSESKGDGKKSNVGSDFNTKKPPLPNVARKNSLSQRYSSWNKIHLSDIFNINRSDTQKDERRSNEKSMSPVFFKSKKPPSPSSPKSFFSNTNIDFLNSYASASDVTRSDYESDKHKDSNLNELKTKKYIFKTSVSNSNLSSSHTKRHSVESFRELCKESRAFCYFLKLSFDYETIFKNKLFKVYSFLNSKFFCFIGTAT